MRILDTKAAINKAKILSNINTNILSAELQRVCPRKEILIYFVGMLCFMGWNEGFSKCPPSAPRVSYISYYGGT